MGLYGKEYYQKNRVFLLESRKQQRLNPVPKDVKLLYKRNQFILGRLSNRSRVAFRRLKLWLSRREVTQYITEDPNILKAFIESRFKPGMTWANYGSKSGKWNFDHIKPLSKAKDVMQLIAFCHYTNVQPLWIEENSRKGTTLKSDLWTLE